MKALGRKRAQKNTEKDGKIDQQQQRTKCKSGISNDKRKKSKKAIFECNYIYIYIYNMRVEILWMVANVTRKFAESTERERRRLK